MKRNVLLAAVAAVGLARGAVAAGVVVYDNLGTSPYNTTGYATFGLIDGNQVRRGTQFTAGATVELSSLDVVLGQAYWDGTTYGGTARIELVADAGGAIGSTVLESWTSSSLTSISPGVETLASVERPTLTKGTKYWVVLSGASGSYLGGAWWMADSSDRRIVNVAWQSAAGVPVSYYQIYGGYRTRVSGAYLPGDLTGDGRVTADDYALIDRGYAKHLTGAADGDFNGDGVIDAADYLIIDTAFAAQNGGLSPGVMEEREGMFWAGYVSELAAAVPEPGMVGVGCAVVVGGALRRRRG